MTLRTQQSGKMYIWLALLHYENFHVFSSYNACFLSFPSSYIFFFFLIISRYH
jgi:uncharacterized membrane protein